MALLHAQCPRPELETLHAETFEPAPVDTAAPGSAPLPLKWTQTQGTNAWEVSEEALGAYPNPGEGAWLRVVDRSEEADGMSVVDSDTLVLGTGLTQLLLSYDLSFQEYDGKGAYNLWAWDGAAWVLLHREEEDFVGKVELDVSLLANDAFRLRLEFDDEGGFAWGVGVDNLRLVGLRQGCESGYCDEGEHPEECPADCPPREELPPSWVPLGKNLAGETVPYRYFRGNTPCDDCSEAIELGFELDFYGKLYDTLYLNANGNVTFGGAFVDYTPEPFCLEGPAMVAPFFADADLREGGSIRYYLDPEGHYAIFDWLEVPYYGCEGDCDRTNSFQLVLTDGTPTRLGEARLPLGTTVIFSYAQMNWTTGKSSGGEQGFYGHAATVGLNQGDGRACDDYGTFDHEGFAYYGNVQDLGCPPNGVHHLQNLHVCFNGRTGKQLRTQPPYPLLGNVTEAGNLLSWRDPPGIDHYVVERSLDGLAFELWELVFPDDGLRAQRELLDSLPANGLTYYRILLIYEDGTIRFSPAIALLNRRDLPSFDITRYGPNPMQRSLSLAFELPRAGEVQYVLADMAGRVREQGRLEGVAGENLLRLEVEQLEEGLYVFTLFFDGARAFVRLQKGGG